MSGKRVEVPRKSVTVTARYRLIFGRKALRQPEFFWILLCETVVRRDSGFFHRKLRSYEKNASRGDAHSREKQMSAKADHARRGKSVLLERKWNREGVRSTLLFLKPIAKYLFCGII